jgi:hypothetical protein
LLREEGSDDPLIEWQLDHQDGNDVKRAYDRSTRIKARHLMMQKYADYLDRLRIDRGRPQAHRHKLDAAWHMDKEPNHSGGVM